jgi:hypothetical protein
VTGSIVIKFDSAAIRAMAGSPGVQAGMDRLAGLAVNAVKREAPVSKVQPIYATRGATVPGGTRHAGDAPLRPSGYLRSSVHAFRLGDDRLIGPVAPYGGFVVEGTPAHSIDSTGPWPLRNRATGQVFGPHVNHPGTAPNDFITRGVQTVALARLVIHV